MAENQLDIFFETSAKNGENIQEVFYEAARKIMKRRDRLGINSKCFRKTAKSLVLPELNNINGSYDETGKGCPC